MRRIKINSYCILIFLIYIACIEVYYRDYTLLGENFNIIHWILFVLGDRLIILLVLGLSIVIFDYRILTELYLNTSYLIRYKGYMKVLFEYIKRLIVLNFGVLLLFVLISCIVVLPTAIMNGLIFQRDTMITVCKLFANIYLWTIVLGTLEAVFLSLGFRSKTSCVIMIFLLLINVSISGQIGLASKDKNSLYWITNMLLTSDTEKYAFYVLYWCGWLLGCVLIYFIKVKCNLKKIIDTVFYRTDEWVKVLFLAIIVFGLYGILSLNYVDNLMECFWGFKKFDVSLCVRIIVSERKKFLW